MMGNTKEHYEHKAKLNSFADGIHISNSQEILIKLLRIDSKVFIQMDKPIIISPEKKMVTDELINTDVFDIPIESVPIIANSIEFYFEDKELSTFL
jgi:hypothetical protein